MLPRAERARAYPVRTTYGAHLRRERADLPTGAAIRDSRHPERGFLPLGASEWLSFAHLVAAGR